MKPNPEFVAQMTAVAKPGDALLLMCRSGGRSAMAVHQLDKARVRNDYTIVDGMEGDSVTDPEKLFHGKHLKNGWKNSGLPWTYDSDPGRVSLPKPR